jgi:IS30 family transposase
LKNYTQLSEENRFEIYGLRKAPLSLRKIAQEIGKSPSTISRELKRNEGSRGYRPKQAQEKATDRRKHAKKFTKMNATLKEKISMMLIEDWSPEQISGILSKENILISTERIYQYVWADKKADGKLFMHLRHGLKNKKRKRGAKDNRGQIKNKISIHDRPEIVNQKLRIGDLEIDLVVGKDHKGFILTVVDRVSKFLKMAYVEHKDSASILRAVVKLLNPLKAAIHTITSDNGKEFADHEIIAEELEVKFFFADAYASWQRGLNENTNGLLRQYFPKKFDFTSITEEQLKSVENKINNRPRKLLDFLSPFQVFSSECSKLGIIC